MNDSINEGRSPPPPPARRLATRVVTAGRQPAERAYAAADLRSRKTK
jgi:hypothetical protein